MTPAERVYKEARDAGFDHDMAELISKEVAKGADPDAIGPLMRTTALYGSRALALGMIRARISRTFAASLLAEAAGDTGTLNAAGRDRAGIQLLARFGGIL